MIDLKTTKFIAANDLYLMGIILEIEHLLHKAFLVGLLGRSILHCIIVYYFCIVFSSQLVSNNGAIVDSSHLLCLHSAHCHLYLPI